MCDTKTPHTPLRAGGPKAAAREQGEPVRSREFARWSRRCLAEANTAGLSDCKAERVLRRAEGLGLVYRWASGRNRPSAYANVPQAASEEVAE